MLPGYTTLTLILLIMVGAVIMLSGCDTSRGEGFAIYLTREDIPPNEMAALSHVNTTDKPIISVVDIITYNAQTHEMKLTNSAFESISRLEVPVTGKSFVVCIDREPIYWGGFLDTDIFLIV